VLAREGVELACWSIALRRRPDLELVERLARAQLGARRIGCSVLVRDPCADLSALLELVGLRAVLVDGAAGGGKVVRQPEGGEQLGVEEVVVPDDPVA
jgi:hypothetical protein